MASDPRLNDRHLMARLGRIEAHLDTLSAKVDRLFPRALALVAGFVTTTAAIAGLLVGLT